LKLCGDNGHKAKDGRPCGFKIADSAVSCHHHAADKTRQREIVDAMRLAQQRLRIPEEIETNEFATVADCLRVRAQVVKILKTEKRPDFRRLDMILKATNGASNDHSTKAQERQNEILLQLDGHGAGLAALQRLKESPIRVLPGRRTPPSDKGTA
jgi:hypothetical protein